MKALIRARVNNGGGGRENVLQEVQSSFFPVAAMVLKNELSFMISKLPHSFNSFKRNENIEKIQSEVITGRVCGYMLLANVRPLHCSLFFIVHCWH